MKKTYFNPEAMILSLDLEDILTTSGGSVLSLGDGTDMENDGGFYDKKDIGSMFQA